MHRVAIKDLVPKLEVESTYMVKFTQLAQAKDGKDYLNIILSDATGDIEARVWTDARLVAESIEKGGFVRVVGKANMYLGKKQFIIKDCSPIDQQEVDANDFIMKAKEDPEKMYRDLISIVEDLTDVYIKDLLLLIIKDKEIQRRLKTWQAGKTIHHAYQSGLLEHILSCTQLSLILSKHYGVNHNYVIAGAILHDLCKVFELSDGFNIEYTEEGKLVGHLVKGVELIDKFSYRIKGFPYDLKLHLKHILLSHHGHYEYGSPKLPQTSEAMLLHLIDLMDSKMHAFETIKRNDQNSGHWSGYVKHLDRIVFKSELPFYPDYIDLKPEALTKNNKKRSPKQIEVKQNLGSLLKDIKIDKED